MFIQTEETPNPQTLKFIPGVDVMGDSTFVVKNIADAKKSPLSHNIFNIDDVESLFFGSNFISVTKSPEADWQVLKPSILSVIMEFFVAGNKIEITDDTTSKGTQENDNAEEDSPIVKEIKELIDTRVRPAVAEDGGDIIYHNFEDGIVYLEMHGACAGCPSSSVTLKEGIESMLKHYIPEVEAVEQVA